MSDIQDPTTALCETFARKPISRRGMMGRVAALSVAGATATGLASPAAALGTVGDTGLLTFKGRYAIHGGKIIQGYFAAPRGKSRLEVMVVIPGENGLDARTEATARRHALAGYITIAPDVRPGLGRDAAIAEVIAAVPNLKRHPHGNGKVTVVAA